MSGGRSRASVSKAALLARLVALARREIGTREAGGNNRGARVEEYQQATWLNPAPWPWCAAFTCWLLREWLRDPAHVERLSAPVRDLLRGVARVLTQPDCDAAEDRKVTLMVEVINRFEQFLVNTAAEAVAYVNEVGSPACRILLDTFHLNIEEDSIGGAIRHAGKLMRQLHLGETNRKPPGLGHMPWPEIKAALDDIGFDGSLVMEPFVLPGGQVARDIAVWRPIIENPDLDALARDSVRFVRANLA